MRSAPWGAFLLGREFDDRDLPSVAVYGLTLSESAHVLYAATHGRGAYALSLPTP
jgi:hypothetical protein